MHETKALLIKYNGLKCMYCGRVVPYRQINWHHIIPKVIFKSLNEPVDNSYENGALLCLNCHALIHTFDFNSKDYQAITQVIRKNKKPIT